MCIYIYIYIYTYRWLRLKIKGWAKVAGLPQTLAITTNPIEAHPGRKVLLATSWLIYFLTSIPLPFAAPLQAP